MLRQLPFRRSHDSKPHEGIPHPSGGAFGAVLIKYPTLFLAGLQLRRRGERRVGGSSPPRFTKLSCDLFRTIILSWQPLNRPACLPWTRSSRTRALASSRFL